MVVGEIADGVDLLVVGGGPGGYAAALRAAELGREVTLVDRDGDDGLGGVCLRTGCIPSKALIELADGLHALERLRRSGLTVGDGGADMEQFQEWKSGVVAQLNRGVRSLLRGAGVRTVAGRLRLTRPNQAVVETPDGQARFFEFADLVLATGSRAAPLAALPVDGRDVLDAAGALALTRVPDAVAVVGAGYIGVELGTALAKLGSRVTLVEALDRILPSVDPTAAGLVQRRAAELGMTVLTNARARDLASGRLVVDTDDGEQVVAADTVVVAVGRVPNSDDLGLERAGVPVDPATGLIPVGRNRVAVPHVAAVGDITAGPALAHKATAEAGVAAEALSGRRAAFDPATVPAVVFSDPEVATAGMTATDAAAAGIAVTVSTVPLRTSGRALTMDATTGFLRLVSERDGGGVVGVHIVGPHASELIAEGVLAIEMGATAEDLARTIHPHPTLSEQLAEGAQRAIAP